MNWRKSKQANMNAKTFKSMVGLALAAALSLSATGVHATNNTPVGLWQAIDDATGKPISLVRIKETSGRLDGWVEKILNPADESRRCDSCPGDRKGQPVQGLNIIQDLRRSADNPLIWRDGEILDPKNGHAYRLRVTLQEDGRILEVRGYIGSPFFGRTQIWRRVEE